MRGRWRVCVSAGCAEQGGGLGAWGGAATTNLGRGAALPLTRLPLWSRTCEKRANRNGQRVTVQVANGNGDFEFGLYS